MIFNVGAGVATDADKIKYDNSNSGLESDNLQGAVDELGESVDGLNNSLKFLPDYEKAIQIFNVDITSPTTYTAPDNGIIMVYWYITGGGDCYAMINNVRVAETGVSTGRIDKIFVKKGDVVNFVISNALIAKIRTHFVPLK